MGLLDMMKNAGEAAQSLSELDDIYKGISEKLTEAHEAGKVDGKVWDAFQAIAASGAKFDWKENAEKVQNFAGLLSSHADKLPADLKPLIEKLDDVVGMIGKAQGFLGGSQ